MVRLQRHPQNPILLPNPASPWQALNVFNPAVVYANGLFHMIYRAQGLDYISRLGYAVSVDGVRFNRLEDPIFEPEHDLEWRGVEDPRVVWLEDRFFMTYTGYSRQGIQPYLAESTNLIHWQRRGVALPEMENKDHVLFPERVGGRYVMLHRRPPAIWIAFSEDLEHWEGHRPILEPRPGLWDEARVGAGGPPIPTEAGWLLIYHGVDARNTYRLGLALLDREDPTRVVARPKGFVLEPEEVWELRGDVPNVVFACANPVVEGTVYVYYGGADRVIGLATAPLEELVAAALKGE
ncbi:glycoside hydrolase family 130 protein [Marinithermus hydrothermalis]|uniref:Glycosidase related protein n=1 Tax=Marinithermus hydrothermalis (strain DSM 14884 / JCM 11576 / T1) TaxID=869210 RepID=F2NLZ0_MARHT|nr:glycosidase [Marinithermus hydrothermalis]AEB11247.1 glycosidase related protein [Marinithermus hydrothermalis DSM 14884]